MFIGELLSTKLSDLLRSHLGNIGLDPFSRISADRLIEKALPNIGLLELVSADDFSTLYDGLYNSMFPHDPEREQSERIVARLQDEFASRREGLAPYRIIGIRDATGIAIGAAQFSILLLQDGVHAVPYLQYLYVRPENRRQDMAEVLHMMVAALTAADARNHGDRIVPFTLFETEPPAHGDDVASQTNATQRAMIHARSGAIAMMFQKVVDNVLISPHVQPGLEVGEPPVSLVWVIRPLPSANLGEGEDVDEIGRHLIAAYYQSLRDEGFPEDNISLAETIVQRRSIGCRLITMPLCDVVLSNAEE